MAKIRVMVLMMIMACGLPLGCAMQWPVQWPMEEDVALSGPGNWRLVWSDEFDKPGAPDPKKWTYQDGIERKSEAQLYTRRPKNVRVERGVLVLETHRERIKNPNYRPGSKDVKASRAYLDYTGGGLTTRGLGSWQYGRFEARIRQPRGVGAWTAFWTMGVTRPWPAGGEVDIMEWWGANPAITTANVHYEVNHMQRSLLGELAVRNVSAGFHVYALVWTPARLDFYFDGRLFHRFAIDRARNGDFNPFRQPHYLLLNSVIDGPPGKKVDPRMLPQKFEVDYVRVYQRR